MTDVPKTTSLSPPSSHGQFHTTFACLSLHESDKIRMLSFPKSAIEVVRAAINQSWGKGIQAEQDYYSAHQFKLRGNPWSGQGSDAVPSRVLLCCVLSSLYSVGWIMCVSFDVSKKLYDKDSLIFRYQNPLPNPCTWFAISFNRSDLLRIIGAPDELITPFKTMLGKRIQRDGWKEPGAYEFKLRGNPWWASGGETVTTRMLLLQIFQVLETYGFSIYASIDQSMGGRDTSETDTWYCSRETSWTPGAPVFH